jgi:predicted transcriptional regulator
MAKELTLALIQTRSIPPDSIQETLQHTYATLTTLKAQEEGELPSQIPAPESPLVEWRKSITKHTVTCLECRQAFKQLSGRHLRTHGLDKRSYRTKHGIPSTQPLAARETTTRRRQIVRDTRPWEKTAMFRRAKMQNGSAAAEPDAEAVRDEIEEPSVEVTAQPKRQRKTATPKQAARTKRAG